MSGSNVGTSSDGTALEISRRVMAQLLGPTDSRTVRVEYWEGSVDGAASEEAALRLTWPGALRRMLLPPDDRSVGEAYVRGDVDFQGDLEALIRAGAEGLDRLRGPGRRLRVAAALARLPSKGASEPGLRPYRRAWRRRAGRDVGAVRHHYDLGNDFFRLFLDEAMQYSCAYFRHLEEDLEVAQRDKLHLICRKLRLRPGEHLLDVGTGWGGLLVHAARHYGVRATGITLSERQAQGAREAIRRAGLEDRCRVEVRDYRELGRNAAWADAFDKAASVGMIEHVGRANYPSYFQAVRTALRPGGLFLNHGIVNLRWGRTRSGRIRQKLGRRRSFIHRYIFPGSDLVPLAPTLDDAERAGFEVRDVESLREHYARTLRAWVARLEGQWPTAVATVGEPTARAWRFYMAASAHLFASGSMGIAQSLLALPDGAGVVEVPSTREDLYDEAPGGVRPVAPPP